MRPPFGCGDANGSVVASSSSIASASLLALLAGDGLTEKVPTARMLPVDDRTAFIGEKLPSIIDGRRRMPPTTSAAFGEKASLTAWSIDGRPVPAAVGAARRVDTTAAPFGVRSVSSICK